MKAQINISANFSAEDCDRLTRNWREVVSIARSLYPSVSNPARDPDELIYSACVLFLAEREALAYLKGQAA